jgi:hypothetical protein
MVHINSLIAYHDEHKTFNEREKLIYGQLMFAGRQTDREIKDALFSLSADMNTVRPRVSDLIEKGWVKEVGQKRDAVTGKTVRIVKALTPEERADDQLRLAI